MAPATPSTRRILNMLEPITFPSAISTSSFLAATIDVTSSGRLVPSATIVSPIRFWLNPRLEAIVEAPFTTKSPPNFIATAPPIIYTIHCHTGNIFISSSVSSAISTLSVEFLALSADLIIQPRYAANNTRNIIPSALPSAPCAR